VRERGDDGLDPGERDIVMRTLLLVCSLAVAGALILRGSAPDVPSQTMHVTSLVVPASMYVDERVAVRASIITGGTRDAIRTFTVCHQATGECVRTSRGTVPSRETWTGFVGWLSPQDGGTHSIELVLHEDWGVDSPRATTRVTMTLEVLEKGD